MELTGTRRTIVALAICAIGFLVTIHSQAPSSRALNYLVFGGYADLYHESNGEHVDYLKMTIAYDGWTYSGPGTKVIEIDWHAVSAKVESGNSSVFEIGRTGHRGNFGPCDDLVKDYFTYPVEAGNGIQALYGNTTTVCTMQEGDPYDYTSPNITFAVAACHDTTAGHNECGTGLNWTHWPYLEAKLYGWDTQLEYETAGN